MTSGVPRVKPMHDRAAKTHCLARFRRGMQRVVVPVESVQMRRLGADGMLVLGVWSFTLGRGVVLRFRALGTVPTALADEEGGSNGSCV